MPALSDLYDDIWVYGLKEVWDPLTDMNLPAPVRAKMSYTGYLRRTLPQQLKRKPSVEIKEPYLLVTAGGGGDGYEVIDWVLRAYETECDLPLTPLFVLGPFMGVEQQDALLARVDRIKGANAITFDSHVEFLMAGAAGVVAMGGYNTFCEILSFDKRAVIVPRVQPRQEQFVRAREAQRLGLVRMLLPEPARDARDMAAAIRNLPSQPRRKVAKSCPSTSAPSLCRACNRDRSNL